MAQYLWLLSLRWLTAAIAILPIAKGALWGAFSFLTSFSLRAAAVMRADDLHQLQGPRASAVACPIG
jgi:hypothetical protein